VTDSFVAVVADALQDAGREVVGHRPAGDGHGDPAEWRVSGPLDRTWVETRFDLGSLAWWYVGPDGGWVLVDALTQATLHGTGAAGPVPPADEGPVVARPLAHVASVPELRRRWTVPAADDELAVLGGTPLALAGPHLVTDVVTPPGAEVVLERVSEVLRVVLPRLTAAADVRAVAADLPDWFVDACAPERRTLDDRTAWAAWAYDDLEQVPLHRWVARWTVDAWLDAMVPAERTWWLAESAVADDGRLHLAVLTASRAASTSSLRWLLRASGASACATDQAPAREALVVPVPPHPRGDVDPDAALAAVAHDVLGVLGDDDPLVLQAVPQRGAYRWEHRTARTVDVQALARGLATDTPLTWGADGDGGWVTNGWSTVRGPVPQPAGGGGGGDRPRLVVVDDGAMTTHHLDVASSRRATPGEQA
jgi:hypothetical protein